MSKVSSTTLFHFMEKKEWLISILRDMKMFPRYVLETFPPVEEKYLIPMKCFCDIPLSNIVNHTMRYGNYGIGLKKEFAYKYHISPVQYFHQKSDPFFALMSINFESDGDFTYLIPYFKFMFSDDKSVYYYEEREWRYIVRRMENVTNKTQSEIEKLKQELNKKMNVEISFEIEDIEYIFVENNIDLLLFLDEIEKMNFTRKDKNMLISKLVTIEQIRNDF